MVTTVDPRFPPADREGYFETALGRTWYRVTGELPATGDDGQAPLVVLHGGPGAPHNYTLMMANLARADGDTGRPARAVVHADQIGCGGSTERPDAPSETGTGALVVAELRALVHHLGIERFHLLGPSRHILFHWVSPVIGFLIIGYVLWNAEAAAKIGGVIWLVVGVLFMLFSRAMGGTVSPEHAFGEMP